jgi:para-nitrobenzyl esterase
MSCHLLAKLPIWIIAASLPTWAALDQPIQIETGSVQGVIHDTVTSFKGIPYATPPVGELRWREPKPPKPWQGTRRADQFSAACSQAKTGPFGPWSAEYIARNAMEGGSSEDCLYVNVWTAAAHSGEKRPVLVWIYGGGFNSGSGDVPVYDGEGLASKGVVMVSFNYRVGVFGFLAHPELTRESVHNASGNYALLDMIAALKWVQKNIAAFGGDPRNVTIAGQSAGAFAVNYLMASPLAKGLFERAIAESGGAFIGAQSLQEAETAGGKLAETLGAHSIAELRTRAAETLLRPTGGYRASPIIDGYVVRAEVATIFAERRRNDVPLLTGWNADDGVSFGPAPTAETFRAQAKRTYGDFSDAFLKAFPASTYVAPVFAK